MSNFWLLSATMAAVVATVLPGAASLRTTAAEDILARSRTAYAALTSYADSGTVVQEFGPSTGPLTERHTFTTRYRAPRHFYFDFTKHNAADRFVVWSDDEAFRTWWQATGVDQTYPKGSGATAFVTGGPITKGSLVMLAPLLFPQAGLSGTLTEFGDATAAGEETVNGRRCHKLTGVATSVYQASGRAVNVRRTTIWIDAETLLVRKVFEDTPDGTAASQVSRTTTTFEPRANPMLSDDAFRFAAPVVRKPGSGH